MPTKKASNQSFGQALEAAKNGGYFRLPSWSLEVVIKLQRPDSNSKMTHPYLYVTSRFGKVPWIPTMVEILSEGWDIEYPDTVQSAYKQTSILDEIKEQL